MGAEQSTPPPGPNKGAPFGKGRRVLYCFLLCDSNVVSPVLLASFGSPSQRGVSAIPIPIATSSPLPMGDLRAERPLPRSRAAEVGPRAFPGIEGPTLLNRGGGERSHGRGDNEPTSSFFPAPGPSPTTTSTIFRRRCRYGGGEGGCQSPLRVGQRGEGWAAFLDYHFKCLLFL